jgi:outer membrane protein assembly factor BamE (lipoprotein component of BamABCDE complex)
MLRKHSLLKIFPTGLVILTATFMLLISGTSVKAQTQNSTSPDEITQNTDPLYRNYKGVTIGMTATEVRTKLGQPKDSSGGQDFYTFSEKEVAQIFYDKSEHVKAISITYIGQQSGAPDCKALLGFEIKPTADGTMRKLVRYPKAGYWVSYSNSGEDEPVITVTIQKMLQ